MFRFNKIKHSNNIVWGYEESLLYLELNKYRVANDVLPLSADDTQYINNKTTVFNILKGSKVKQKPNALIGYDYYNYKSAFKAWIRVKENRELILNPQYNFIGVAISSGMIGVVYRIELRR